MALSCSKAVAPARHLSSFASRIESVLPPNWTLEENGQEVIIKRNESVTTYPCVGIDVSLLRNPDGLKQFVNNNGITETYRIKLRRAAAIDRAEYQRLKAINDQIVVTKSTPVPHREFFEDDATRSFDSRYRELPEYYDDASSIYFGTTSGPYECIYPSAVARECESIRRMLDSLFNRYSVDDSPRTLSRGVD